MAPSQPFSISLRRTIRINCREVLAPLAIISLIVNLTLAHPQARFILAQPHTPPLTKLPKRQGSLSTLLLRLAIPLLLLATLLLPLDTLLLPLATPLHPLATPLLPLATLLHLMAHALHLNMVTALRHRFNPRMHNETCPGYVDLNRRQG